MEFEWDSWQREVLEFEGNITLRTGRQVGKSVVVAEKSCRFAFDHADTVTLVIAASQRQSSLLFEKIKWCCEDRGDVFEEVPTLTKIILKNGSRIYSLPAGKTGHFIRGFTIDLLICDEAAFVPEIVWNAVIPMIAVSRKVRGYGWIILLSTPFGKGGYYYDSFTDKDFKQWHVSSEDCSRIPRELLVKEKKRLSKEIYLQEWCGEFTEDWHQFFKTELIKRSMTFITWSLDRDRVSGSGFYLGVDVARYGGDENAFVIVEMFREKNLDVIKCVKCLTTERVSVVDTIGRIEALDKLWGFKRIFIDDGGLGGAVTDILEVKLGKRRVVGLNNASKRLEVQGEEKKRGILKEDLYSNVLVLLENHRLELISDLNLLRSLKSITFEYNVDNQNKIRIFGTYTHLTEALVRACWCVKEKGLDVYCY